MVAFHTSKNTGLKGMRYCVHEMKLLGEVNDTVQ
jgi:hypothetical protein